MTTSSAARIGLACTVAALAACGGSGSQQPSALTPPGGSGAARHAAVPAPAAHSVGAVRINHHKSWISPDAKRAPRLLFISDYGSGTVDIFTMPALALKGQLTGFSSPEGECSDTSGNVWIANTGGQQLELYTRTGTLVRTLSDTGEFPAACALDKNGNLAVANIENSSGGPGNITIFANATGPGTPYTNAAIEQYFFVNYDPNGNLFFDGTNTSRTSSYFAELPAGSSTTHLINLSGGTLHLAGFIQWYRTGNYIALGDQGCGGIVSSCVYWVTVSGSTGTITATTNLTNYAGGNVCDLVQGVIAANGERYLAGMDYESCGYTPTTADRWPYEAGGSPTNYNNTAGLVEPIGAAVSTK
jgi:hypothetical protein